MDRECNVGIALIDNTGYKGCDGGCGGEFSRYFIFQDQTIDLCGDCAELFEGFVESPKMLQKVIKKALKNVKAHNKRMDRDR